MTKLLISVRDAAEAMVASEAGADLIDIKEPRRGSLGRADHDTIRQVAEAMASQRLPRAPHCIDAIHRVPLSIALGELTEFRSDAQPAACPSVDFAKLGLAGCAGMADWRLHWDRALAALAPDVGRVAVIYADWQTAHAPRPEEVLSAACELGCRAALVDTFDKRAGGLLDHWSRDEVGEFVQQAQASGMLAVVAGSLTLADFPIVTRLKPDYLAVRGAACAGPRTGSICRERVERLVDALGQQRVSVAPA